MTPNELLYNSSPSLKIGILSGLYWEVDRVINNFVKKGEIDILWPLHPLERAICALRSLIAGRRQTVCREDCIYLLSYQHNSIDPDELAAKHFLETDEQKQFCQRLIEYTELLKQAQKSIKSSR